MKRLRYADQIFYSHAPSRKWSAAKRLEVFESTGLCLLRLRALVQILAAGGTRSRKLADKLSKCKKGKRCHSGACPTCMRAFRLRWAGQIAQLICADDEDWCFVTLVPPEKFKLGDLSDYNPKLAKDRLRKQFARGALSGSIAVGGIDFSFNVSANGNSHWQPHWHILIKSSSEDARTALKQYFPGSSSVVVKAVRKAEVLGVATYTLKSTFKIKQPRPDLNNKAPSVSAIHLAELMPLLDRWGIVQRLFQRF